jgi:hypothetical protein
MQGRRRPGDLMDEYEDDDEMLSRQLRQEKMRQMLRND